ncbi:MAG: hypothetical protein ACLRSW_05575 [Christensenellaceae bacterium]
MSAIFWRRAIGREDFGDREEDTVLIIGAGPTGICTMLRAAETAKQIVMCERTPGARIRPALPQLR